MNPLVKCPACRQQVQTRPLFCGDHYAIVTHLVIGVKCHGSGLDAITDDDVVMEAACRDHGCDSDGCLAGCLCSRCDETRSENGPLFGEAQ
jgi:hypothetical protein